MENNQALPDTVPGIPQESLGGDFRGLFSVREFRASDTNFVLATFLRGIYYGDSFFSRVPKDLFMERYKRVAQGLVTAPQIVIRIACLIDDPDVILGYAILSQDLDTVLYAFTKSAWRRRGIAKSLIPQDFKFIVPQHLTALGREIIKKYNISENPFF